MLCMWFGKLVLLQIPGRVSNFYMAGAAAQWGVLCALMCPPVAETMWSLAHGEDLGGM